jgi:hypothetical protein
MTDASLKRDKLRLGSLALKYSERAAALGPNNAEAQLSVAITYGKMLPFLGSKEQVNASPKIKTAVDKALALDPRSDTAWHVLGRWNRVLAEIGTVKRALGRRALRESPDGQLQRSHPMPRKGHLLETRIGSCTISNSAGFTHRWAGQMMRGA